MNAINQQFKSFVLTESECFSSIIDVMYHTKKEDGRMLLSMMNNLVDYTLQIKPENNEINYQIIHVPNCPDWTRELLIRFIIYKSALYLNKTTVERFKTQINKTINLKEREGKKELLLISEKNKYFRKISNTFNTNDIPNNRNKSLIIAKEQDLLAKKSDKNPWIYEFFTEKIDDTSHNLILSTTTTAFDIEKMIKGFAKEDIPIMENIFIFHSPNKSNLTNSYNKNQLERLNKYGCGIKKCIVFSFSDKPFRLYHTIDNVKYRLASSLLNKTINKYDEFEDFITFTQEETDFLFNREIDQVTFFVDCQERIFFMSQIDQLLEQFPHNLRYKNNLALSFTDVLQNNITQSINNEIKDFPIGLLSDFFNLNKQIWLNSIKNAIEAFIKDSSIIGFVFPKDITNNIKLSLISLFKNQNRTIRLYSLDDIKNGVKADKLIVFQYRYTEIFYKSYPNTFDPLPLVQNQQALVIVNQLTHNNYYEWNIYWYNRDKHGLLFSTFRREILGWRKKNFQRPILSDIKDYMHEAETDARIYQTDKCKVFYKDGSRSKEHMACERILYKQNGTFRIAGLKDIAVITDLSIQMLDEIVDQVKNLISKKSEDKTKTEILFRKDPKFNLSESEINSSVDLWKILLKREVTSNGEKVVYDAIFSKMPDNERISFNTFNQWHDLNNGMILPRSRKHQKALLMHLGFELGSAYHHIIIAKKLFNINNSRLLNSQIEILLQQTLVNKIDEKRFNSLSESHSDIFTLLGVGNIDDINVLISLLDISLTPIERIEYDQD